jgi:hypothetical protein
MGTLDQQLGKMGGGDPATYVNMFFLVLPFVSLVGVPISGWVLDKLGTVVSLFITRYVMYALGGWSPDGQSPALYSHYYKRI